MTTFTGDRAIAEEAEPEVRRQLEEVERMAAKLSEFTVDFPIGARPPLTSEQREVAVALNLAVELLDRRAEKASIAEEERWRGLSDASTMLYNEIGRRGLPQLWSSFKRRIAEEDEASFLEEE